MATTGRIENDCRTSVDWRLSAVWRRRWDLGVLKLSKFVRSDAENNYSQISKCLVFEKKTSSSARPELVSGWVGGGAGIFFTHPLDTVWLVSFKNQSSKFVVLRSELGSRVKCSSAKTKRFATQPSNLKKPVVHRRSFTEVIRKYGTSGLFRGVAMSLFSKFPWMNHSDSECQAIKLVW